MKSIERTLTRENIDHELRAYEKRVEEFGESVQGKSGRRLLESLKREKLEHGPYPGVTLFEAANRVMTDLVIYHGVRFLLQTQNLPFKEYIVEFGNENKQDFDISAKSGGEVLIGEAFNVAPSFFGGKKLETRKKLLKNGVNANYKIIVVNHDAAPENFTPDEKEGITYVIVNIGTSSGVVVPNNSCRVDGPELKR